MNRIAKSLVTAAVALSLGPAAAGAQTKTIPGETATVTATVEAIEQSTRALTLKGEDGMYVTVNVPKDVKRFDAIKVGDKLTATYYTNVVLRLKHPGEKDVDSASDKVTRGEGAKPVRTGATQRTITATIAAIDLKVPSVTFTGPNNWKYSSKVQDLALLKTVKVGDKVEITWTEALLVSFGAPAK